MNTYLRGTSALAAIGGGGESSPHLAWWENTAILVGMLASIATLVEITIRNGWRR